MSQGYQSGIVADGNSDALFISCNVSRDSSSVVQVRQALAAVSQLQSEYQHKYPDAGFYLIAAIGSHYWSQLSDAPAPALLAPFPAMAEEDRLAPSTPTDLLFHIRSERHDLNYEAAQKLFARFGDAVTVVEEVHGFRYLDNRDLTGFVDGTENPQGEKRASVALVGNEDPQYAGGSYLHIQRYEHDLEHWNKLPVKEQEDSVGRTKVDNIEYSSDEKPLTAHVKRAAVKDSTGKSLEILRHSMPYGNLQRKGLLFASYCASPENFTRMLESMINGDGHGHTDHLLKYTRAVTGAAYFAPPVAFLEQLSS